MRTLITGISGFAGGHLAARVLQAGHEVCGTVQHPASVGRVLARLGTDRLTADAIRVMAITDAGAVDAVLRHFAPDIVFHLAGTATVGGSDADPATVFAINALGTLHLLAAVRAHCPRARVVTVGSGSAYGPLDAEAKPMTEEDPFRPVSPYGASKAAADLVAHQWARAYGLDVVRVRPFNHIGPGQGLGFVCPDVARQLIAVERGARPPVVDVGNVDVVRDFTDVRDVVAGYVLAAERGEAGEAYNICSGVGRSVRELVQRMIRLCGVDVEMRIAPHQLRSADVPVAVGSPQKFQRATGWRPDVTLEQSLTDILADWRRRSDS
jgi:GDP-4-dehydro-6-deoxy-D-mannose reductase